MSSQTLKPDDHTAATRRQFLARAGLLAAAASVPALPARALNLRSLFDAPAASTYAVGDPMLAEVFQTLVFDTFSGLLSFVVPGDDCYSLAQGVAVAGPGGALANGLKEDLADCRLNGHFIGLKHLVDTQPVLPGDFLRTTLMTLSSRMSDQPIDISVETDDGPTLVRLDEALSRLLDEGQLVASAEGVCSPLPPVGISSSLLSAVVLNVMATIVNPGLALGGQPAPGCGAPVTPFAQLNFVEKQRVFELLDLASNDDYPVISTLLGPTILGLMSSLGSGLMTAASLVSFSEAGSLDVEKYLKTGEVEIDYAYVSGWDISSYQRHERLGAVVFDTVHGWDVFDGYYEDRKEATD